MCLFGGRTGVGIRLRVSKRDCMNLVLSLLRRTHFEIHFLKVLDVTELNDLLKVVLNGLNILLFSFLILKIKVFSSHDVD